MKKAILGETRMNRIKTFVGIAAFSLVVLALPSVASAQWGGNGRNDDYYGNNRNNRNIQATVRNLKNRARNFERAVDRYDDRDNNRRNGRWGGGGWGNNSGNLEGLANSFKNAADRFANEYGRGRDLNNSADEARRLLDIGRQIDQQLYSGNRGGNQLANEWSQIRYDLQVVADVYGYGGYNNRNPNGRNRNNGDWRNRVPFPLPF
jgi:hypothetical protein